MGLALAGMREGMPVRLGILQRYVMGDVLRAFALALLTITTIFVLFMVMAEAARSAGLTPLDILRLIPFIIPSSLPYTMPVALLFAVTVVYGRLAADNEIIAIKTAGQSPLLVLMPSFLVGLGLSLLLVTVGNDAIPRATHQAKKIIFGNMEDLFYKILKKERQFDNPSWPFYIKVKNVEDKKMIEPIFKHRDGSPHNPNAFDMVVQAKEAVVNWDLDHGQVKVHLVGAQVNGGKENPDFFFVQNDELIIPLPDTNRFNKDPQNQELTYAQLVQKQNEARQKLRVERKRQAVAAAMWIGSGRFNRVDWPHFAAAFTDYARWNSQYNQCETEKQMRTAQAWGSFFFVLLGAPVGVLFARRDFLSAFISCFLPIIGVYYPLMLAGVNLGKEGLIPPIWALWAGNAILGMAAGLVLRRVIRH